MELQQRPPAIHVVRDTAVFCFRHRRISVFLLMLAWMEHGCQKSLDRLDTFDSAALVLLNLGAAVAISLTLSSMMHVLAATWLESPRMGAGFEQMGQRWAPLAKVVLERLGAVARLLIKPLLLVGLSVAILGSTCMLSHDLGVGLAALMAGGCMSIALGWALVLLYRAWTEMGVMMCLVGQGHAAADAVREGQSLCRGNLLWLVTMDLLLMAPFVLFMAVAVASHFELLPAWFSSDKVMPALFILALPVGPIMSMNPAMATRTLQRMVTRPCAASPE